MTVVAHGSLNRSRRVAKSPAASNFCPDAIIAAILGAENLLIPAIDPAILAGSTAIAAVNISLAERTQARGQSDFELLKEVATTYDADFWVDGNVLYLSRFLKDYTPRLTLAWGQNMLDFSPKVSTIGQVAAVAM